MSTIPLSAGTLPAEELTLEGFAADGRADTMAPGPLLATILGAIAGQDLLQERDSRPTAAEPSASDGGQEGSDSTSSRPPADGQGPSIGAMITITVPHTALGGDVGPPGEAAGFGILDHVGTRDLVAAAARNPATRWCVTVLNPDGTAAAHGCAAGSRQGPWISSWLKVITISLPLA